MGIGLRWMKCGTARALVVMTALLAATTAHAANAPVLIGVDAEFGHKSSTSAEAVRRGVAIAIDEINAAGGVLNGRKLELITTDNRSVPARGVANLRELAAKPNLLAVFGAKFSPVVLEQVPVAEQLGVLLMDPWAAADGIIAPGHRHTFRLSLTDSWALDTMMRHARKQGAKRVGLLLPNTGWGRSSLKAAQRFSAQSPDISIAATNWYNWGDASLIGNYLALAKAGAQAIILVANESEGSLLVREMARLDKAERLPVISHWGVTGGDFVKLAGPALQDIDFSVVQTYSFIGAQDERARRVLTAAKRLFGVSDARALDSPVGVAHAYDLTHILALAINRARSAERKAVRDALEKIEVYDGLVRRYAPPFTAGRHEALVPELLFMARFERDGAIVRIPNY